MAVKKTAQLKKKGDRGGVNPGNAGANVGRLPYGAVPSSQSAADPVGKRVKRTRAIGYNER